MKRVWRATDVSRLPLPAFCAALFLLLLNPNVQSQDLSITEFMASNGTTLLDEDGDSSDWIEVHNMTAMAVSLGGWHLTDNATSLTKWTFPAQDLEADGYLVVFASGKDRRTPGSELHTNFNLAAGGEYLALVEPDGVTIANEFSPEYPPQYRDYSYGLAQAVTTFIPDGATANYRVPTVGDAGLNWQDLGFNDAGWSSGDTGLGYSNSAGEFTVTRYQANTAVGSLAVAEQVISDPGMQSGTDVETAPVINYWDTGDQGRYTTQQSPFPGMAFNEDANDFVIEAVGTVTIPSVGPWTFGVNSDDGFGLDLTNGASSFRIEYPDPRGTNDTLGVFNVTQPGRYDVRLVMFERGGGAACELFAAQGSFGAWDGANFDLVGDTANGGLPVAGFGGTVGTNVEAEMLGINSTLWARLPFTVDAGDLGTINALTLRMKYDDGFVAYLNGVPVAQSNEPAALAWNSAATADQPADDALIYEDFSLSAHLGLLQAGNNVLAIHGLNDNVASDDFLLLPELVGVSNQPNAQYFDVPTPGSYNQPGFAGFLSPVEFSVEHGFFDAAFRLDLSTSSTGASIHYTTDGTWPDDTNGAIYNPVTGISINDTSMIRAVAVMAGFQPSTCRTHTYIFLDGVIQQPTNPPGFPASWGSQPADYEMDPDVVNDPLYNGTIVDDLKSIPTLSIVTRPADMFEGSGIYANPNASGVAWEKPASFELIHPDGREGFSVNCGLRIYGGVGRNPGFLKHTFRLLFKSDYGPTKLRYDLFDGDRNADDEYDTIILRAGFNNAWHRDNDSEEQRAQYLRDNWMSRSQWDMGQKGIHGTFHHLYVNGLYWGLYNTVERPNADFASSYYGGRKEDWDALNSYPRNVVDGVATDWVTARNIAQAGVADQAGYDALAQYVDIPNLIDYMILNFYAGNSDWDDHNWYAASWRTGGGGYKFFSWDAERTLEGITGANRTGVGQFDKPSYLYSQLRANPLFLEQFAQRAHMHLFNDGALTPAKTAARYRELSDFIDRAIVGESARWGDSQQATPYTRDGAWLTERDRLLNQYFPQRTDVVIGFLQGAGLYPSLLGPEFYVNGQLQYGGDVDAPSTLTMRHDNSVATIYYMLDGGDPRMPDDSINPAAQIFDTAASNISLIPTGADWKYFDSVTSDPGTTWRDLGFDDSGWASGPAQLGYGDGDEATLVGYGGDPNNKHITTLFRHRFTVTDPNQFLDLTCRILRDDGAVVYINGAEAFRSITLPAAPAVITWQTTASNGNETTWYSHTLPTSLLQPGPNIIAVEIHQTSNTSSDISLDLELFGTEASSGDAVALTQPTRVTARCYNAGSWSALSDATYTTSDTRALRNYLRITELDYHPYDPTPAEIAQGFTDPEMFEFIELRNTSLGQALNLVGVNFTDGVDFVFPSTPASLLAPGAYVLVVRNQAAFEARYGAGAVIAGEFENLTGLNNGGEHIELVTPTAGVIHSFTYDNGSPWPTAADGAGPSLEVIDTEGDYNNPLNWRASAVHGGTPGRGGKPDEEQTGAGSRWVLY